MLNGLKGEKKERKKKTTRKNEKEKYKYEWNEMLGKSSFFSSKRKKQKRDEI